RAVSTLGSFVLPGLMEISGGEATAEIRALSKKRFREAQASSRVQGVSLLGGLVQLEGLRWDVVQTTGPDGKLTKKTGTFRIGSATIAGQTAASPDADASTTLTAVNTALA